VRQSAQAFQIIRIAKLLSRSSTKSAVRRLVVMALLKQSFSHERFRPVLVEPRPQPCDARKMTNFVYRMVILMVAPLRSIRWEMAKRRTGRASRKGAAPVHYRGIEMAGF
jgi:hypothetical protein